MWYVMQAYTGTEMEICEKCRSRIMEEEVVLEVLLLGQMVEVTLGLGVVSMQGEEFIRNIRTESA